MKTFTCLFISSTPRVGQSLEHKFLPTHEFNANSVKASHTLRGKNAILLGKESALAAGSRSLRFSNTGLQSAA